MIKILSKLLDLIYKKRCYFCGCTNDSEKMCSKCSEKITLFPSKKLRSIDGINIYCASLYKDVMQKLIRGLKYHNQKELAFYQAKFMLDYWQNLGISKEQFVIVPVPLYPAREKERSYNHMLLVAKEFATLTGYEVADKIIKRVKNTKPQYKLSKSEREENLKDAFELCGNFEDYKDKNILIIDDILTTGSTLSEMLKTFKNHSFNHLYGFVTSCSEYNLF